MGTGPKGRIVKGDVINYMNNGSSSTSASTTVNTSASASAPTSTSTPAPTAPKAKPTNLGLQTAYDAMFSNNELTKVEPIRGVTRLMVKSMNAARQIQTFVYADEIRMDNLITTRKQLVKEAKKLDLKFSYMPYLIKATSLALLEYPKLNSSVNKEATEVTYHASHNIGIAMDTPKGLVVPVIRNCERLSMFEIAAEVMRLQVYMYINVYIYT